MNKRKSHSYTPTNHDGIGYYVKTYIQTFVAALLILFTLLASANSYASCVVGDQGTQTQNLYAGQTTHAGTLTSQVINDSLVITYETIDGWMLDETHLWIGTDLSQMPQTRKGSPKIGNFPYSSGASGNQQIYSIPLEVLGFSCPSPDTKFYVAAHASVVQLDGDNNVIEQETAWGEGQRFVEKGMWGTYSSVTLTCDCGSDPPDSDGGCETAFAYSGGTNASDSDITHSFLDLDLDSNGRRDFSRWGWSNGSVGEGLYTWDIFAGAGQSDISKGTNVGTLTVDYSEGYVTVEYNLNAPYYLEETHLYVGNEILPRDVTGDYTVAPGQYPYKHEDMISTLDSFEFSGSGEIYVVAHAKVCGFN